MMHSSYKFIDEKEMKIFLNGKKWQDKQVNIFNKFRNIYGERLRGRIRRILV
jgi:hypothetical protein